MPCLELVISLAAYHCRIVAAQRQRRIIHLHAVVIRALLKHGAQPGVRRNSAGKRQGLLAVLLCCGDELLCEDIRNGILEARRKAVHVYLLALLLRVVDKVDDRGL